MIPTLNTTARRAIAILFVVVIVNLIGVSLVVGCPTCKDGLMYGDASQRSMATGYFYSILFMMSMPFLVLGTFGSCAYFSIRKARLAQEKSDDRSA